MNINDDDLLRIRHMLDAANEVVTFTTNAQREDLDSNVMLLRAMSMSTGIIGEAATRISEEFREAHPKVPWRQIIRMRNFLYHEYFKVDPQVLWDTATHSVPELIPQLERLLQQLE